MIVCKRGYPKYGLQCGGLESCNCTTWREILVCLWECTFVSIFKFTDMTTMKEKLEWVQKNGLIVLCHISFHFFFFNPPPSFVALPCAACLQYMGKKSSAGILVGHKTEEQNSKLEQLPIIRSTVAKGYTSFSQTNKTLNIDNGPWCTLHYFFMLMLCGPVPKVLHSDRVESGRLCR